MRDTQAPKYQVIGQGLPTVWQIVRTHDLAKCGYQYTELQCEGYERGWSCIGAAKAFMTRLEKGLEEDELGAKVVWIQGPRH